MRYRGRAEPLTAVWIMIIVNLLVFIATIISPDLIRQLGISRATFLSEPWTIITSMFTHSGFSHILFNMLTFFFFSRFLISLVGTRNMLIIYFVGGILGGVFWLLLSQPFQVAVGASGAVFALGGALTAIAPRVKVYIIPIPVPVPLWTAIIGGFVLLLLISGVAWQGHLGGLIFGLLAGLYFRRKMRYRVY